jgi:curved DNA-binding protein CbpA
VKDYYAALGANTKSSIDEIKLAYRKMALKFHPDQNKGDRFFEERFKEVQEAYSVLSNVTKALYEVFRLPVGPDTVFKGGTAPQKGEAIIERFSEDIDLVVLRREGDLDNKIKAKLKAITLLLISCLKYKQKASRTNQCSICQSAACSTRTTYGFSDHVFLTSRGSVGSTQRQLRFNIMATLVKLYAVHNT